MVRSHRARPWSRRASALLVLMVLTVAMVPLGAAPLSATIDPITYWVDDDGDNANPGTEAEPFATITYALTQAGSADTVMVKPGTYSEAKGEAFPLLPSGESIMSSDGADVTILEGNGSESILIVNSPGTGDTVSGLTFTNAGGGWAVLFSMGNSASPGWPLVEDNIFRDNADACALRFSQFGSGSYVPVVRGNQFLRNTYLNGAGLYADMQVGDSGIVIEDNVFAENEAESGAALMLITVDTTATITGNTFVGNEATANSGGAFYLSHSGGQTHTIARNTFETNQAASSGGAVWMYGATVDFSRNDCGGNSSGLNGGFGWAQYCSIESENDVIGGCSAPQGSGWYLSDSYLAMRHDTVVDCDGASVIRANTDAELNIDNSILWNEEAAADVVEVDHIAYSCVFDDAISGTGVMHDDPGWLDTRPGSHDFRIGGASPCIDTGTAGATAPTDFLGTARPVDGDRNGSALPDMGAHEYVPPRPDRLSNRTRYSTAIKIMAEAFPGWEGVTDVVIACGDDRAAADPLAASGLCWAYDAPMLLVPSASTPAEVKTAIAQIVAENGPINLRVVGGTSSVPNARINDIKAYVGASNIAVADRLLATGGRYDLARAIAKRMKQVADADPDKDMPDAVLFANGADSTKFFDALALSPISAHTGTPILLVSVDKVPPATTAAIADLGAPSTRIVGGGPNTVSNAVLAALGADRWYGQTRYDTAIKIADNAVAEGLLTRQAVGIAAKLPDALTGGAFVGREGGVLLITDGSTLTPATKNWLVAHQPEIVDCYVFGGELSVKPSVVTAIDNALK